MGAGCASGPAPLGPSRAWHHRVLGCQLSFTCTAPGVATLLPPPPGLVLMPQHHWGMWGSHTTHPHPLDPVWTKIFFGTFGASKTSAPLGGGRGGVMDPPTPPPLEPPPL